MEANEVEVEAKFVIDAFQKKLLGFLCHFAGLFKGTYEKIYLFLNLLFRVFT